MSEITPAEAIKIAIEQKKQAILNAIKGAPFEPLANEAPQSKYEDILAALQAAEDKLNTVVG